MARYALVIGIAEYLSPSLSRLSKTTNDAEAIAQLLEQYGDFQSVQRLPQRWNKDKNGYEMAASKVTGAEIGQELRKLLLEQATNNEVLIYFSGHGFITSDTLGQQEGFLATSDCQVEVKGNQIVAQKYGISLNKLNKLIGESQLSSLVVLLDCCHSGYFLERELVEQTLTAFRSLKDYYLIAACRRFEKAAAIMSEDYSIFTGAVIKGLAAENTGSSGRISSDRLFDFVSNELVGSIQEPIRMSLGRPITLVSYPQLNILKEEIAFNQENPYQGLSAFESEQAQYFCGRDEAVRTLVSRLAESRFLAIIGYSGSGKSSLVKAGVLPQLKSDRLPGSSKWKIVSLTPGEHPYGKLVDILVGQQQQNQPHILFIDQFEEIFTLCQDDEERKSFIRLVAEEVKTTERQARIILTIRGDFLKRCNDYLEIITLINSVPPTTFIVPPMSFAELEEAIEKPAKLHGVNFERGLVSQITNDVVTRPGALPILQYALKELWRVCIEEPESPQPLLTRKGYEEIGAVKGALDKRATIVYQSLATVDQAFARRLFMELVQLSETGEVTRRRASLKRLEEVAHSPQQLQRVVGLLAGSQQRLIITDKDTVEVAHEALLSEWKLLNTWIAENLDNIRLSRSLEEDCHEWVQRFNQSDDALLAGAKLAVISEWVNKTQLTLPPLESEFLRKSLAQRDRELQSALKLERELRELAESNQKEAEARAKAERQKTLTARIAGGLLTLLTAFAIIFGIQAEQRKNTAIDALLSEPKQLFEKDYQIEALIASIKALSQFKQIGVTQQQKINILDNILENIQESNRLEDHTDAVLSASFNRNEQIIATGSADKNIKIWSLKGQLKTTIKGHANTVSKVIFSPDNKIIASASYDRTLKIWTIRGILLKTLKYTTSVYDISFSPKDYKIIASANGDGTIQIWNIQTGQKNNKIFPEINPKEKILRLDFSPDGSNIAFSRNNDNLVRIWDIKNNKIKILGSHKNLVSDIKFSPDKNSNLIASSDYGGDIKIWNVKQMKLIRTIITSPEKNLIYSLAFSPNGKKLASSGLIQNKSIQLWDMTTGKSRETIRGHTGFINQVSFISNDTLLSVSNDRTARIWQIYLKNHANHSDLSIDQSIKFGCDFITDYLNTTKDKLALQNKFLCNKTVFE
ncbi:MAG: caspase family protein [Nostoc sp.]|uniref:nSTAND1 domain-containing NTPase n=1 Tax=Nostoc sp. TaxID=1180 RepID=UPI002FF467FB